MKKLVCLLAFVFPSCAMLGSTAGGAAAGAAIGGPHGAVVGAAGGAVGYGWTSIVAGFRSAWHWFSGLFSGGAPPPPPSSWHLGAILVWLLVLVIAWIVLTHPILRAAVGLMALWLWGRVVDAWNLVTLSWKKAPN